MQSGQL